MFKKIFVAFFFFFCKRERLTYLYFSINIIIHVIYLKEQCVIFKALVCSQGKHSHTLPFLLSWDDALCVAVNKEKLQFLA